MSAKWFLKLVPPFLVALGSVFLGAQAPVNFSAEIEAARRAFERGAYFEANEVMTALAFTAGGDCAIPWPSPSGASSIPS